MAPKRKNDSVQEEKSARDRKKQKMVTARTIAVQPAQPENAVAGPSGSRGPDSLSRLPSSIDVEKFTEARAFEINAMEEAIQNAGSASTQRAWQALPRHLRRRAASHDVRRVPLRIRDKARAEMDPIRKKALGRSVSKLGKDRRLSKTEAFLKRQRDKLWLETHLWHAKRMKMENMWGYRLAVTPSEKAFRPSHRASVQGSIIHDASYYSLVEISGPEEDLKSILIPCCDPQGQGPGAKKYLGGSRTLETHLYGFGGYPFDYIAPVTVLWKPLVTAATPNEQNVSSSGKDKKKSKGKAKANEPIIGGPNSNSDRVVWLRSHPSMFETVFATLHTAISSYTSQPRDKVVQIELADLRGKVNAFEIMGPKANQVIRGALNPISQDTREDFRKFWSSFGALQSSGSVPRGMIIGFKVDDPRLKFPPKNAQAKFPEHGTPMPAFPSPSLAQSEIWDEPTRIALAKPRYKKKDLDDRRSQNLVPGTPLTALRQDDRIPVLLIQRSLETPGSDSEAIHGWTLIIPAGWSMAFFSSLIFTGSRVGGQRERQTQAFEAGTAYFLRDFPATLGYKVYSSKREEDEKGKWERKPPAKRPNYEKVGIRSPWRADWEVVLGLQSVDPEAADVEGGDDGEGEDLVPAQREPADIEVEEKAESPLQPWLLRGSEVPAILASMSKSLNPAGVLLSEVNRLRSKRGFNNLDSTVKGDDLLRTALLNVRVTLCRKGAPDDYAAICALGDDELKAWRKGLEEKVVDKMLEAMEREEVEAGKEGSELMGEELNIIGYVTTGHFSLSRGHGFAIGAISLAQMLHLQNQTERLFPNPTKPPVLNVKLRNRESSCTRMAQIEVLIN